MTDLIPRPVRVACLVFCGLAAHAGALGAQRLARRLDAWLDAAPLNRYLWGIEVADTAGRVLFARNADRLFIPASNTKLLVTAAAAVLLPPDLTVRTSVYGTGPVVGGTLQGSLVLYGRGDPTMGKRCYGIDTTAPGACVSDAFEPLRRLAQEVKARGITLVAGDLVGDGSWFEPMTVHPSWEWYDLLWWYGAPVSGLGFTDNSLELVSEPGDVGAPARLTLWPDFGEPVIENRTRTVAGSARTLDVMRDPATGHLIVYGDVPAGTRPRTEYLAVQDPNRYTALAFRRVLAEQGIAVLGATRSTTDSLAFAGARAGPALAEVASRPVRDWLFPILNTSQNWFAEMLLKQLGRRLGGTGSWEGGREVVRRFLVDSVGADSTQFSQRDGSGLAATNLVSPDTFVRLLRYLRGHPRYPVFAAGLPRSGEAGSLRTRFLGTPLAGRVAAKTGSISTVNTLSGYVERPDGRLLVFSIQANHHVIGGRAMIAAIDSLVIQLGR